MELFRSILSSVIAGLVATAIVSALLILARKVGPERAVRWVTKLRRIRWPLLASVFFATSVTSAILRRETDISLVILGVIVLLALTLITPSRFVPDKIARHRSTTQPYRWQILSGMFFLSTVILLLMNVRPTERIVFAVDLADEEMMVFREILDDLEPQLGAEVFLVHVDSAQFIARLDRLVASGTMGWDLIAVDNNQLGLLVAKELVQDLSEFSAQLVPQRLLPALRRILRVQDRLYFAPLRPNVKIAFYNELKFAEYGLRPPNTWDQLLEVARVFKEKEGVGRVAIQGYPGKTAAATIFEFVKAAGGNPLTLDDDESRQAFLFLKRLQPYLTTEDVETTFHTANELLIDDQVYLVSNWTYGFKVVVEDLGKQEIKVYSGWKGPEEEVHVLGGDVLAIPRGAPHRNLAIRLIELLLSKETQQELVSRLRWPPVRLDVEADDQISATLRSFFQASNDAMAFAVTRPTDPNWLMVENALGRAYTELIVEGNDISFLEKHAASLKEISSGSIPYRVMPGDTLAAIASRYNTTVTILAEANGITRWTSVTPGQILLIPQR